MKGTFDWRWIMFVLRYEGSQVTTYLQRDGRFGYNLQTARTFRRFDTLFKLLARTNLYQRGNFDKGVHRLVRVERGPLTETSHVL